MKAGRFLFFIAMLMSFIMPSRAAYACSAWSAVGEKAKDGKTLIAKNWDFGDTNFAEFRVSKQEGKYAFLGQFAYSEKNPKSPHDLDAGINEKGLAMVTTAAASVPRKERIGAGGCVNHVLTTFHSVDGALADREHYKRYAPANFVMADKHKTAWIEIAPEKKINIKVVDNGVLYHTNHYLSPELVVFNKLDSSSSDGRLRRFHELMDDHKGPFSFDEFIEMSKGQNPPPNNGLWRVGSPTNHERTLATFVAEIPREGSSHVWVRTATKGDPIKHGEVVLDEHFWRKHQHWDPIRLAE